RPRRAPRQRQAHLQSGHRPGIHGETGHRNRPQGYWPSDPCERRGASRRRSRRTRRKLRQNQARAQLAAPISQSRRHRPLRLGLVPSPPQRLRQMTEVAATMRKMRNQTSRREFLTTTAALSVATLFPPTLTKAAPLLYPPIDLSHFNTPIPLADSAIHYGYAS